MARKGDEVGDPEGHPRAVQHQNYLQQPIRHKHF